MRRSSVITTGLLSGIAAIATFNANRIFGFDNIQRHLRRQKRYFSSAGSIATGNRHGGPHLHRREISRRLRQQARLSVSAA